MSDNTKQDAIDSWRQLCISMKDDAEKNSYGDITFAKNVSDINAVCKLGTALLTSWFMFLEAQNEMMVALNNIDGRKPNQ